MCGGSKGQTKTQQTSTTSATPEAMAAYRDILSRAQEVAQTPYQAYEGQRVAGFTPYQEQAFGQIAGLQGAGMGTIGEAGELARRGAAQITAEDIQRGMDPYQQQVIQTTMDEMARQNAIEQSRLQGQAISAGAFGGDRAGIAATELAKRQGDVRAATLASLLSQGYGRAVAQAQADRQAAQVGTGQLAGLAQQEFAMPLSQAQALAGVGTAQQQLAQQQLNVPYQTYLEQRAYPYQQAQWLAGLSTGVGGAMGGTTQAQGAQTPAQPNPLNAILGGALTLGGFAMPGGGTVGGNLLSKLPFFRAEGGKVEGKDGDMPQGLAAAALTPALPYSKGFIPQDMPMRALQAPQANLQMPGEAPDQSKQFVAQAMDLAKSIRDNRKAEMPSAQSWASGTTITPEPTPELGYMADGGRVPMQDGGVPVEEEVSPRFGFMPPEAKETGFALPDAMTPAQIAGVKQDIAAQELSKRQAMLAEQRAQRDEIGQQMAREFSWDVGSLDPEDLARKYQNQRAYLTPQQLAILDRKTTEATREPSPSRVASVALSPSIPTATSERGPTPVRLERMALSDYVNPGTILPPPEGRALTDVPGLGAAAYQAPMPQPMGLGAKDVPPSTKVSEPKSGFVFDLSPEARQAIMQAGFAMMASRSPYFGQAAGEAGMVGMQAYTQAKQMAEQRRKTEEAEKIAREKLERGKWKETGFTDKATGRPILRNEITGETKLSDLPEGVKEVSAPKTAAEAEAEKVSARETAKITSASKAALPNMENAATRAMNLIEHQLTSGEYKGVVGLEGNIPTVLPESHAIEEKLRQIHSGAFTQAFETLKGAGPISNVEGQSATAALSRLKNMKQSDVGYREALEDFYREIQALQNVVRKRAGLEPLPIKMPPPEGGVAKPTAQTVPPKDQRVVGNTYPTPQGEKKWTGTGWVNP